MKNILTQKKLMRCKLQGLKIPRGLTICLFMLACSLKGFTQTVQFVSGKIEDFDLVNGQIEMVAAQVKSITFTVIIGRSLNSSGQYPTVSVKIKLVRLADSGGEPIGLSQEFTVDTGDFGGGPFAEKSFTTSITAVGGGGSANTLLRNNDDVAIAALTGNGWQPQNNTDYNVAVALPPITGNSICCSKCIGSGEGTGVLGQTSGTSLSGGDKVYQYQWQKSTDGVTFTNASQISQGFDLAKNPSFNPGTLSQTTWFRRTVKSSSTSSTGSVNPIISNAVKIEFVNAAQSPTIATTTYSQSTSVKAFGTMTVQGDQTPAAGVQVDFIAEDQIRILPSSVISANSRFSIGTMCSAPSGGRIASPEQVEVYDSEISTETAPLQEVNEVRSEPTEITSEEIGVYPNPSRGFIRVDLKSMATTDGRVIVLDKFSNKVYSAEIKAGDTGVQMDLSNLSPDTYYLKVIGEEKLPTIRFVIQK